MGLAGGLSKLGEFATIERFFAPLSQGCAGALGLKDDAALLTPHPGSQLVVTGDTMVEGVHFFADDPPRTLGRKLLRVSLSDLAAMAARPRAYLLQAALSERVGEDWLEEFTAGLALDQKEFGVTLIGGDTVATPGPVSLALTAIGEVEEGGELRRAGATVGDSVFVSGTVGDAGLGLRVLDGRARGLDQGLRAAAVERYRVPQPRVVLGPELGGLASAAIDVSDGLVADLAHLCKASRVGAEIELAQVPFSAAVREALKRGLYAASEAIGAGDDYEILFTLAPDLEARLRKLGDRFGFPLSRIGRTLAGEGVRVIDERGRDITPAAPGYRHF
jgi:thiamine-monophosphate kinase